MILVDADHVTVARPDKVLFGDLSLTVEDGDRLGIVGINGCGKSTLLRVLSGDATPEGGAVRRGRGVRIAVLPQEPRLAPGPVGTSVVAGLEGAATWEAEAVLDRLGMGAMLDARGLRILAALDLVSRAHGTTPACVAIAWLIARGVTAPIASATNVEQLREILSGATLDLTTEEVAALNRASAN